VRAGTPVRTPRTMLPNLCSSETSSLDTGPSTGRATLQCNVISLLALKCVTL
jgi:hypothetical protein